MLITVLRVLFFFLLSVLVATVLGTLMQSQLNLYELQQLGTPISLEQRMLTSLRDLTGFTPIFALMVSVTFICALPVAAGMSRIFKPWRGLLFALAGGVGIWVAFRVADHFLPMPTFIAATRETTGLLLMMAAVAVGSWLFGRLTRPVVKRGLRVLG